MEKTLSELFTKLSTSTLGEIENDMLTGQDTSHLIEAQREAEELDNAATVKILHQVIRDRYSK